MRPNQNKPATAKLPWTVRQALVKHLHATYPTTEDPLPTEHVDLLLRLRHKERERRPDLQVPGVVSRNG